MWRTRAISMLTAGALFCMAYIFVLTWGFVTGQIGPLRTVAVWVPPIVFVAVLLSTQSPSVGRRHHARMRNSHRVSWYHVVARNGILAVLSVAAAAVLAIIMLSIVEPIAKTFGPKPHHVRVLLIDSGIEVDYGAGPQPALAYAGFSGSNMRDDRGWFSWSIAFGEATCPGTRYHSNDPCYYQPATVEVTHEFRVSLWPLFWILATVPGLTLIATLVNRSVRRKRGLCPACGYNLVGNTSGVCPECGMEAPEANAIADRKPS